MNFFQKVTAYLKDNPEGYWFKRKLYGWGWVPVKWQGWLVIVIFIIFILWNGLYIGSKAVTTGSELIWFFAKIFASLAAVIFICYKKGERPRWQWGIPEQGANHGREDKV
jgi:hypothetical protein